jgi:hypothetical protein
MRKYTVLTCICLSLFLAGLQGQTNTEEQLLEAFHTITSEELEGYVAELSSEKYNGRLTGTPEFIACTQWAGGLFEEWGLEPAGDNGTYYQWFDHAYCDVHDLGSMYLHIPLEDGSIVKKSYPFPEHYFPGMNSGNGELTAEVVYVGYGVTAPEHNYDDYKGIDVEGKIVVMRRDVPYKDARNPHYAEWVNYCYHQYKLKNAVAHGAAGMLYMENNLANPNISYDADFIYCGIGAEPVEDLFAGTGTTEAEVRKKIDETMKPHSFPLNKKATIIANTTRHPDGKGCNVLGLIPGNDPDLKNEVIIVGGHLDGVGNCGVMLPGALDNASGSSDIMAAARAMAQSGMEFKRSILFILIGGEENGLLGSTFYCENPVFPTEKTRCYINLDMVGTGTGLVLRGGKSFPEIMKHFEEGNKKYLHRSFRASANSPHYGRPRSDASMFEDAGIKSMSLGTSGSRGKIYYHHPLDRLNTTSPEIMEDVSKWLLVSLTSLANE